MSFSHPSLLWFILAVVPLLGMSIRWRIRRRFALSSWSSEQPKHSIKIFAFVALPVALVFSVIAFAGPQWGLSDTPGILKGRDVVILIDLSRSMEAADMADAKSPQRWQAGREAIIRFIDDLKRRGGGHRVALMAFAAKPVPLCPLTVDRDHLLNVLNELRIAAPPTGLYPNDDELWTSGTRFGSAIQFAVAMHDPKFEGYQDCILVSDGDDPAPDRDSEIDVGIAAATVGRIPIHTVGIGDDKDGGQLIVEGVPVLTKLEEAPLKAIARRTEGFYLKSGRDVPALAAFFQEKIEPRPSRELPEEVLPQPQERRIWFLLPAIALLCLAWRRE